MRILPRRFRAALIAVLLGLPLLAGCTFSDSLLQDDIRSVWSSGKGEAPAARVFFATDREPQGRTFGLHWGVTPHCGRADFVVPGALSAQSAQEPSLDHLDCAGPQQLADFVQLIAASSRDKCDHVLLTIPGYNTTFRNALLHGGQAATDIQWPCATLVFSWSSEGKFDRYAADIERSGYAVPLLINLLRQLNAAGLQTDIFSQSMGGRIALSAVAALCAGRKPIIDQFILAAPDVNAEHDNDDFGNFLQQAAPCARRVTIYASDNDIALIASESFHGGVPRAGRVPGRDMQYLKAPFGGNINLVDASMAPGDAVNHGYFLLSYEALQDLMWALSGASQEERTERGTLICSGAAGSDCASGQAPYVLNIAPGRGPDFASRLLRKIWPVFLPVQ